MSGRIESQFSAVGEETIESRQLIAEGMLSVMTAGIRSTRRRTHAATGLRARISRAMVANGNTVHSEVLRDRRPCNVLTVGLTPSVTAVARDR